RTFNLEGYKASIHGQLEMVCTDCHQGIEDLPHDEMEMPKVDCSECHEEVAEIYANSLHGLSVKRGDALAPSCADCHTAHDILPKSNPNSRTNPIHIGEMCGACHAEDAPVAKTRNVSQHNILKEYSQSIHGEGIQKKGLTVTAVCSSCHTAHNVLPHDDPNSSINAKNVVSTCMKCHALIEQVHEKVINGKLWEDEPNKVPMCIDCHQPHVVRTVFYEEGVADRYCMDCHQHEVRGEERVLPAVDAALIASSSHTTVRCAQCHVGSDPTLERMCEPIGTEVDCSICHEEQVQQHKRSYHGVLAAQGDPDAPKCLDCHAGHGALGHSNPKSPTFKRNIPDLCARCHREGEKAAVRISQHENGPDHVLQHYSMSTHGKGLNESGLVVTAVCTDCHTAHFILRATEEESSVNPANIAKTCGTCHFGIEETFNKSIHSPLVAKTDEKLPVCSDCHTAHSISRSDIDSFVLGVMETCGKCHEHVTETYFETYHGKVSRLGAAGTAKCHDCHGSHDALAVDNPSSKLAPDHIVQTCAVCHPKSHTQFATYLTHADHNDREKYPELFWAYWGMTGLLVGTFLFFGVHTLLWFPRAFQDRKLAKKAEASGDHRRVERFAKPARWMHFFLIISFLGLALTGMALKFSYMPWAVKISNLLGGFESAGTIHRLCAITMFIDFFVHLVYVYHNKRDKGLSWKEVLMGPRSLVPNWRDVREMFQSIKWFLGKGPRPKFGKFTYWEKFDYFAVFWGVTIIGATGLILWFPETATRFLPGWAINVATIIHSDEALLAVGFIFTIHFFNTHIRPDKFPMDTVMFDGGVPVEELKRDKPGYYEEMAHSGELFEKIIREPSKDFMFWARIFGFTALIIGFTLVVLIIGALLFG
ncbi:MAG: cytochrome c3 family protein, partial [Candidatus Omnitrophica bacterium]|nr:cytochrome c3 family protein [Candidatus Omnitrophota bacterium]